MTENTANINEIITAVLNGEEDLYVEIVRRYQDDIRKVVNAMLYERNRAEEIVQQIFVKAFQALDSFDQSREFLFWIKALARNEVKQHLRTEIRYTNRLTAYREHVLVRYESDETCESHESLMANALQNCRGKLPENNSNVIKMRYEQSLSLDEIAGKIDRTVGATQQLLVRIRLKLKECVEQQMVKA